MAPHINRLRGRVSGASAPPCFSRRCRTDRSAELIENSVRSADGADGRGVRRAHRPGPVHGLLRRVAGARGRQSLHVARFGRGRRVAAAVKAPAMSHEFPGFLLRVSFSADSLDVAGAFRTCPDDPTWALIGGALFVFGQYQAGWVDHDWAHHQVRPAPFCLTAHPARRMRAGCRYAAAADKCARLACCVHTDTGVGVLERCGGKPWRGCSAGVRNLPPTHRNLAHRGRI